jgi:excisionase family DNA binding protein
MSNTTAGQNGTSNLRLATATNLAEITQHGNGQGRAGAQAGAALLEASREGDPDEVRALLAAGADPNVRDGEGWTALMLVTVKGHLDVARELLAAGADPHAQNHKGWTALRFAVSMDDAEALRLLLEAGADVNERDAAGATALMQAAREKSAESLRLLLAHGADVNVRDHSGETALMVAARYGYHEIVRALREAGADGAEDFKAEAQGLFSDNELQQLMEKVEGLSPVAGLAGVPAEATADGSVEQALAPVAATPGALERLAIALEALRSQQPAAAPRVSIADAAHKLTLSLPEAAALSGLPLKHLREAIKGGGLASRKMGRGWRIKRADLEAYVRKL